MNLVSRFAVRGRSPLTSISAVAKPTDARCEPRVIDAAGSMRTALESNLVAFRSSAQSGVAGDMSDKVTVESIASTGSPTISVKHILNLTAAEVLVTRLLVACNNHYVLRVRGVLGQPIMEFLL